MGLSKSTRIMILLGIDSAFFLLELIVGYSVHSLALVADSFHMLNDVISLLVGLWAVKVANQKTNSKTYTYGWQRAETLGALVNGVFLVALCLSIFLEAIQRFVEPQEVSNPKLVLIVGCFGLASNILGLVLFHDVGHSHGGHSHGHDEHSTAEEGHAHGTDVHDHAITDETSASTQSARRKSVSGKRGKRHAHSRSQGYSTLDEIYVHPSSFRNSIIESSRQNDEDEADDEHDTNASDVEEPSEQSPLLSVPKGKNSHEHHHEASKSKDNKHTGHKHNQPKDQKSGGHGHSHGDLNMRGVFLHVLGDALGNVGVIATALFIWLTDYSWRFYADPLVSLIITVIILLSAIPLCKAASRILLQAVPENLSIDDITADITDLDGIISCHHLHVWQLSDTKLIASLHVQVDFDFKGEGSARYMDLARQIRECLHEYGIHSSTIQPEFCLDATHDHSAAGSDLSGDEVAHPDGHGSKVPSVKGEPDACLLECPDSCGSATQCCDPVVKGANGSSS
ncbi:cation efflux protein [Dothidotthia symphoricarpi CBS 119687]|uniref:Cation efflux protein n=1 Tax=Dothidotthia symphoricarpi CBS 119687 TaxID=1392245 RepID=A0A6A6AL29_9PLEO|nr:cation efflux protein [Dothidotthia symphoricarpi CBS 119687]KAF2132510.1 cation efflux protein [Dothidotthia symphoricarpi CBS 119687]